MDGDKKYIGERNGCMKTSHAKAVNRLTYVAIISQRAQARPAS